MPVPTSGIITFEQIRDGIIEGGNTPSNRSLQACLNASTFDFFDPTYLQGASSKAQINNVNQFRNYPVIPSNVDPFFYTTRSFMSHHRVGVTIRYIDADSGASYNTGTATDFNADCIYREDQGSYGLNNSQLQALGSIGNRRLVIVPRSYDAAGQPTPFTYEARITLELSRLDPNPQILHSETDIVIPSGTDNTGEMTNTNIGDNDFGFVLNWENTYNSEIFIATYLYTPNCL